jgi:anti-sigma B factor antagonist
VGVPARGRSGDGGFEATMKYNRTDNGDETVLAIEGTLDAVTAPELRPVVDLIVQERRKLVTLDLASLRLIDSSGVGVIVSLFRRLRETGGQVNITGLHDQPRAIFRLLRLDKVFPTA